MERLMKVLVVCVVMACVAPAMAATWDANFGGAWVGPLNGGSWGDAANWAGGENEFLTATWDMNGYPDTINVLPGTDTIGGQTRLKNGVAITQTGGSVEFANGGANPVVMSIFGTSSWSISSGSLTINGPVGIGYDNYNNAKGSAGNFISISGDGVLTIQDGFPNTAEAALLIENIGDEVLSIADSGQLIVDIDMKTVIDGYIANGGIVGVGGDLATTETVDNYIVSIVPEPATMALLGLGALVLRRKK